MFGFQNTEIDRVARLLGGYGVQKEQTKPALLFQTSFPKLRILQERAGLSDRACFKVLLRLLTVIGVGIVVAITISALWGVGISVGVVLVEYSNLQRMIFQRAERFERDYPAMLLSLASSIRTGIDPLVALCQVSELFPADSVVKNELVCLKTSVDSGTPEDEAIRAFGETIQHPDIKLFSTAFVLARKEGSSLGECLQRLTRVTRHRQSFRRKAKAAIAMQRLSALGIAICSVLIGGMQIMSNSKAFIAAWNNPFGFKAIVFGTFLLASGLLWMFRMGKSRI